MTGQQKESPQKLVGDGQHTGWSFGQQRSGMLSRNSKTPERLGQSPPFLGVVEAVVGLVVAGVVSSGVAAETAVQV